MPRYRHIDTSPRFLAVDLAAQLLPGTFEHALNHLLDREIDLSGFDARFNNDEVGASAFPPAMLLKVVLLAYSRGIVSIRAIERACREHVTFVALSGDSGPHFTTNAQGLIGREMFAIDGVKLPANASKQRSGTRADFAHQAQKMEAAVGTMLACRRCRRRGAFAAGQGGATHRTTPAPRAAHPRVAGRPSSRPQGRTRHGLRTRAVTADCRCARFHVVS